MGNNYDDFDLEFDLTSLTLRPQEVSEEQDQSVPVVAPANPGSVITRLKKAFWILLGGTVQED